MPNKIDGVKMTALEAFKKYFKESLDDSYNIVINMDINELDDSKKTIYYKRTLRTAKNIFRAHFKETQAESISRFVERMINVAEAILNSDKTKQIPAQLKNEYISYKDVCPKPDKPKSDQESVEITIKNNYYTCDSTRCDLPDTVNCKDVLNYMIAHYKKDIHEYTIIKVVH
ncbi:uncharacterized protein LOC132952819 [Metopolophium dirhodum]|uniref:uncharacterized protein LOC132952819 n=1 Tax=Metopolophium dirhodum TaxID=44670 RepID=UPI00298FF773|nr:uncharacterized protein LOC132952819 [Metopolophium dirhodum]